jgi:hypothetical protein
MRHPNTCTVVNKIKAALFLCMQTLLSTLTKPKKECTLACTFRELHVQGQANCNIRWMEYDRSRYAEQYVGFDGI